MDFIELAYSQETINSRKINFNEMENKFREGDFIETKDDLIFDVKGLVHPPKRVVAFIRYFPSKKGIRRSEKFRYEKVYSLSRRYAWLKENLPDYLVYDPIFDEVLCEVPIEIIKKHYTPVETVKRLLKAESLDFLEFKALEPVSYTHLTLPTILLV